MAALAIHFLPKDIAAAHESLASISGYLSTPLECELVFGSEPCKGAAHVVDHGVQYSGVSGRS